jgi:hypothetical protein
MQDCMSEPIQIGFTVVKAIFHSCALNQVSHVGDYTTTFAFGVSVNSFDD